MKLFEQVHNLQFQKKNMELPLPITKAEKAWLGYFLSHDEAKTFLKKDTLQKLITLLKDGPEYPLSKLVWEKACPKEIFNCAEFHRFLKEAIRESSGIYLECDTNARERFCGTGVPYKLEYSLVRKEWYLLWIRLDGEDETVLTTPLRNIFKVEKREICNIEGYIESIVNWFDSRKEYVELKIEEVYQEEYPRIFYAFSCFDKELRYQENEGGFLLKVFFQKDEMEYILSKIRFLGKRVRVLAPSQIRERMRETAQRAQRRYQNGFLEN